jgi:hypothetical protein
VVEDIRSRLPIPIGFFPDHNVFAVVALLDVILASVSQRINLISYAKSPDDATSIFVGANSRWKFFSSIMVLLHESAIASLPCARGE